MRALLSASTLCLLLLSSCGRHPYAKAVAADDAAMIPQPFLQADSSAFYKTHVSVYGKTLTGILGVKNKRDTMLVSFFSEVGVRYFDLMVLADTCIIADCIPQLHSNAVIQTIVADLKTTFLFQKHLTNATSLSIGQKKVTRFSDNNDWLFAAMNADATIQSLTYAFGKHYKTKYRVSYGDWVNREPTTISIRHFNIQLIIDLHRFYFH